MFITSFLCSLIGLIIFGCGYVGTPSFHNLQEVHQDSISILHRNGLFISTLERLQLRGSARKVTSRYWGTYSIMPPALAGLATRCSEPVYELQNKLQL